VPFSRFRVERVSLTSSRAMHRFCALVASTYAAVGVLWVLLFYVAAAASAPDPEWLARALHYRGLILVTVTALLFHAVLVRFYKRIATSERLMRESELKVIDLFEQHPTPMVVYDAESHRLLAINQATADQYGYPADQLLGQSLLLLVHPEDRASYEATLPRRGSKRFGNVARLRHITRTGETRHVQVASTRITYRGSHAVLAMATDVTADVRATAALREQEARFRQLHDSLDDVLWLMSADRKQLLYISPACQRVYGVPAERFYQDSDLWLKTVVPEDREIAQAGAVQLLELGSSATSYRIVTADGQVRWVLDRKQRILDDDRGTVMYGGILYDVTDERAAQQRMAELNETLERRVAERTSELVEANAELESFSRTVAHDLKSPLNGVVNMADLLAERRSDDSELVRMLGLISRSGRNMSQLVDDLLRLSRVSLAEVRRERVDLTDAAESVIAELREAAPDRQVHVKVQAGMEVYADPGLLTSLLRNLVGNAWKYTSRVSEPRIEIGTRPRLSGAMVFFVRDNGAGFDIGRATRLFEPFQRFHSAKEFSGTGVGLATCRRIARRHGGDVWAESLPGAGSTFFFTLEVEPPAERVLPSLETSSAVTA
jgi:PAS domain S-box-containing protein